MAKVQQKPPVFDALQFTGGQASAKTIVEGAATLAPNYVIRYQPARQEFGLKDGVVSQFPIPERLRIESMLTQTEEYALVGSWVMVSREGILDVLTDAEFTSQYQPV